MMNQTNETQNISENMKNAAAVLAASAGTYGNVYVGNALIGENPKLNVADRGFLFVQPGLSIGAGSRQLSVNLIYNSKLGNVQSLCGGMPAGWKLDAHQLVVADGMDESGDTIYKYIDSYGYVHTFIQYNTNEYSDAEGKGYTLKLNGSQKEIIDFSGNKMVFDGNGRIISTVSGFNSAIEKKFSYTSGRLTRIYDSRNANSYISLSYSGNVLQYIYIYQDNVLKATLYILKSGDNFSKVQYKVNDNGTSYKTLASFVYTLGKLSLITDEQTKSATHISYSGDYVDKIEQGYNEGSFVARTSLAVSVSDARTILVSEKGVYTSYYLDNKGNIVSTFEGESSSTGDLHTTEKDIGHEVNFTGDKTDKINGHAAREINKEVQITENNVVITTATYNADILDKSQNVALHFWVKLESAPDRANLNLKATLSGGSTYSKTVALNVDAVNAWQ